MNTMASKHTKLEIKKKSATVPKVKICIPADIVNNIIKTRVMELLKVIHAKYPHQYKKDNILLEVDAIMSKIKLNATPNKNKDKNNDNSKESSKESSIKLSRRGMESKRKPIIMEERCHAKDLEQYL